MKSKIRGFIDVHIHGCAGFDAGTCTLEQMNIMSQTLIKHGVVGYLPTIASCSIGEFQSALNVISNAMEETFIDKDGNITAAKVIGAHLEGPFLMPAYKGALAKDTFLEATVENYKRVTGDYADAVKRITIDPLTPGAMKLIEYLSARGVLVSCGHTEAKAEVIQEAFKAGATSVTHLYNAMPSLHHRSPGLIGASLADEDSYAELILDFLHVQKEAAKLAIRAKSPDKILIISDSCEAAGMPDGNYTLGGSQITVINGEARKAPEMCLAGSTVFMDKEFENILKLGFDKEDAEKMLSVNQSILLGIEEEFKHYIIEMDEEYKVLGGKVFNG